MTRPQVGDTMTVAATGQLVQIIGTHYNDFATTIYEVMDGDGGSAEYRIGQLTPTA